LSILRGGSIKCVSKNNYKMETISLALIISLSAPLLLLPVEKILPYPYIIEELLKLGVVFLILKAERRNKINLFRWIVFSGLILTFSESVFYLTNIFALGNFSLFPQRIVLTGTLHMGTMLILYFSIKKGYFRLISGVVAAILIHYFYNLVFSAKIY